MTSAASRVLIIGGGFSGMSAAIELRKQGASVDLVEIDPGWRNYGAGISLGGATLRAFRQLGILEAFLREGNAADGVQICLPHGPQVAELPTPRIAGPDVPGGGAIMRPVLARILADATRASGTNVMLGCSFTQIESDADGVDVSFTDGQRRRYDVVIGADGLYSKTRALLFPDAPKPRYSGQACWRAVLPRPPEVTTATMWMGRVKPGVNPVS
jgi:2-polyprenyl-6-methoxyphenol hydroxylase-like FAD-dependent oxidoreductase